jgi:hypothetical protein
MAKAKSKSREDKNMSEEAKWFQTGQKGEKRAEQIAEEQAKNSVTRLWLPVGKSALVTFLDSDGFYFYEHQLKINGSWRNWYTCLRDMSECPICDTGDRSSYVAAYTIIDHSKYTSKRTGKEIKNVKKLLILKSTVQAMWARRKEEVGGDLTQCVFKLFRDKAEHTSTGEDVQFKKKLEKEQILKFKPQGMSDEEWLAPFNYVEIFKPLSVDKLRKLTGQKVVGSDEHTEDVNGGNGNNDDMPAPEGAGVVEGDADIESLL